MSASRPVGAGRFRPASSSDFSLYARHLAWLLDCKLQAAQELLAQAYGYADAHELREVLAQEGSPGPFQVPTRWPLFSNLEADDDDPAQELSRQPTRLEEDLHWMRETTLDERLRKLVQRNSQAQFLGMRELGALEAGFFCAPKVHRQLFAQVKTGCLAQESGPDLYRTWLERHWPVGYWALLRLIYGYPPTVAASGADASQSAVCSMALELCRFRAPDIYLLMTAGISVPGPGVHREFYDEARRDQVRLGGGSAGLYRDSEDLGDTLDELLREHRIEVPAEEEEAVAQSWLGFLKTGANDLGTLHPLFRTVTGLPELLRTSRLLQLQHTARAQREGEVMGNELVVLTGRQAWPNPHVRQREQAMNLVELAQQRRDEMRVMLDTRLELRADSVYETADSHMSLWAYVAEFAQVFEDERPAVRVAQVRGWFIVPYDGRYRVHPDDFFECMDAASAQLNDVWKVLQGRYFPSRSLENIDDYVEHNPDSGCLATAEIEVAPAFRKQGLVPALLNAIYDCFEESPSSALDAHWQAAARTARGDVLGDDEALELQYGQPGIPGFQPPGVFVLAVAGDPPTDRVLRPQLRSALGTLRRPSSDSPKERLKRKLMMHFEGMRDDVESDIICYDPYDYPGT